MKLNEWRESLKKRLVEDAVPGYQSPLFTGEPTQFSPIPAEKVLREITVDEDFLRGLLSWAGVEPMAAGQVIDTILNQNAGTLIGSNLDSIIGSYTNSPEVAVGAIAIEPAPAVEPPPVAPENSIDVIGSPEGETEIDFTAAPETASDDLASVEDPEGAPIVEPIAEPSMELGGDDFDEVDVDDVIDDEELEDDGLEDDGLEDEEEDEDLPEVQVP